MEKNVIWPFKSANKNLEKQKNVRHASIKSKHNAIIKWQIWNDRKEA